MFKRVKFLEQLTVKVYATDIKDQVDNLIIKIILITIVFFISSYLIKPYIKLFDDLEEAILVHTKGTFLTILKQKFQMMQQKLQHDLMNFLKFLDSKKQLKQISTK